jgi:hypothetical protein
MHGVNKMKARKRISFRPWCQGTVCVTLAVLIMACLTAGSIFVDEEDFTQMQAAGVVADAIGAAVASESPSDESAQRDVDFVGPSKPRIVKLVMPDPYGSDNTLVYTGEEARQVYDRLQKASGTSLAAIQQDPIFHEAQH